MQKKYNFAPDMGYTLYNNRFSVAFVTLLAACALGFPSVARSQESAVGSKGTQTVRFDHEKWNFGDVAEDGGKVEHAFVFTNVSSKPVVVLDVVSGCGCTTPSYSRKPVMRGEKGEIVVSFDPMNRPGHFSKGISVQISGATEPVTLLVEGVVTPRVKSTEELYPFDMGGGVRFDSNFRAFAYVGRGERVEESIGWINTSGRDVRLSFEELERSGMLRIEAPRMLKAGEKGAIVIAYEVPSDSDRYGTLSDVLGVDIDGRRARTMLSVHAIAVDRHDTAADDMSSPKGELSKKFIKFGDVKHGRTVADASVELTNIGDNELVIRAVEWQSKALKCSLKAGDRVAAGGKTVVKFTLDTSEVDYGVWVDRVRIITDDPSRPMQTLRVTAVVVE
ncbi:DUF1573 domain-containing protein [Alistipes sp. Z76]|nr:DUF1573 domain-containing protein [Alistipes sp. Z76]NCE68481.1 DUF1573 domain-containing protein [Muribaculaceae bacterium M3]